jgi:hypothetical protein
MAHDFVPGLELSRLFYQDAMEPLLRKHFGHLPTGHSGSCTPNDSLLPCSPASPIPTFAPCRHWVLSTSTSTALMSSAIRSGRAR